MGGSILRKVCEVAQVGSDGELIVSLPSDMADELSLNDGSYVVLDCKDLTIRMKKVWIEDFVFDAEEDA